MAPYLRIDDSLFCTVAICDKCGHRHVAGAPATAWAYLARHAKNVHGDPHAASNARHAKWWRENMN